MIECQYYWYYDTLAQVESWDSKDVPTELLAEFVEWHADFARELMTEARMTTLCYSSATFCIKLSRATFMQM